MMERQREGPHDRSACGAGRRARPALPGRARSAPVGDCRLFVAREVPTGPELLVKLLPARLSLAVDSGVFEREVLLVADRLRHPQLVAPRGAGRAGAFVYHTRAFVAGTTLRAW